MTEKLEYLIPRRIDQGYQFVPGWGLRQAGVVVASVAVGAVIGLIAHLLRLPAPVQVVPGILLGGAGVMAARPLPDGSTLMDLLAAARDWSRRPKQYLYNWSREDV